MNRFSQPHHLIANPAAGKGKTARDFARVCARLDADGIRYVVQPTKQPGHATELAKRATDEGAELVVAVGGDGTVREVADGLIGSQTAMAILPLGSGNDLARSLGIPLGLEQAAELLRTGMPREIDLGEDNGQVFTCLSGVGYASEVVNEANRTRFFKGSAAYFAGVFKAILRLRPIPVRIHLENESFEEEVAFVLAQNTPYCGGGQLMAPGASLSDGKLDIIVVTTIGRIELMKTFPRVYAGTHITHPAFHIYRSSSLRIESEKPMLRLLDGDLMGTEPLHSVVRPGALRVVAPSSSSSFFSRSSSLFGRSSSPTEMP